MSNFYTKTKSGEFVPITFKEIVTKGWDNKLISVRIGSDELPADESEIQETLEGLNEADALESLEGTSFLVSLYNVDFEVLDDVRNLKQKYILVQAKTGDNLTKLGSLQKNAKDQLRGKVKKTIVMPTPITLEEYAEVEEIRKRLKTRRLRRSR